MAKPVKYKKPRKINPVSVSIFLVLAFLGLLAWEYIPLAILKSEAYRVLESTSSTFAGRKQLYIQEPKERDGLRRKMQAELNTAGVTDPEVETWIEVEGKEVTFGVVYTKYIDWPAGIVERTEEVYQLEHVMIVD